jgi:hypothetical protein
MIFRKGYLVSIFVDGSLEDYDIGSCLQLNQYHDTVGTDVEKFWVNGKETFCWIEDEKVFSGVKGKAPHGDGKSM